MKVLMKDLMARLDAVKDRLDEIERVLLQNLEEGSVKKAITLRGIEPTILKDSFTEND